MLSRVLRLWARRSNDDEKNKWNILVLGALMCNKTCTIYSIPNRKQ